MYSLFRQLIELTEEFENEFSDEYNLQNFSTWLFKRTNATPQQPVNMVDWDGKDKGRSAESIINASLVHLYRYAKIHGKLAIADSPFRTIDDVIFLLNLRHVGPMTRTRLIEINIHEKSTGTQIINRLYAAGFVEEVDNAGDRRSKYVSISESGKRNLDLHMDKVREASRTVVGNLSDQEKMHFIRLLQKLETFHEEKRKSTVKAGV